MAGQPWLDNDSPVGMTPPIGTPAAANKAACIRPKCLSHTGDGYPYMKKVNNDIKTTGVTYLFHGFLFFL
ncbi:hypothetical protein BC792_12045 [Sphingobacterium allocomposti]|uniref:Uncharacterized protein n=1 Tax=Sphingobacterium allocomposti TaxID=415956 RepID=A0A5S5D5K8_9SPHI|nr:hypothetical protein BC792_12045 [Sphingobacterium composti Yoo et al. 2007 non Ten et al. 2007]